MSTSWSRIAGCSTATAAPRRQCLGRGGPGAGHAGPCVQPSWQDRQATRKPRAYLIRTATNLWIDHVRRVAREHAALAIERVDAVVAEHDAVDAHAAGALLFQRLHPQERAALVMKGALDLSLEETATMMRTTVG